jgi:hypothetical protein
VRIIFIQIISLFLAAQKVSPLDIVFVVEGSEEIGRACFVEIKDFVKRTIDKYTIGEKKTRVALVEYSDTPRTVFSLDKYNTKPLLKKAVEDISPSRGKTADTTKALELAKDTLDIRSGGRPGAAKVIILVTGSTVRDKQNLERVLNETKESKGHLYVIAIGNKDIDIGDNVVNVDEPEDTSDVVDDIVETISKNVKKGKIFAFYLPNPVLPVNKAIKQMTPTIDKNENTTNWIKLYLM